MISSTTITIVSAVVGGIVIVALFALLTVWLYRRRFVMTTTVDEEAASVHDDNDFKRTYLLDRKSFRLLAPPQVARIAPPSFRTADSLPDPSLPIYGAAAASKTSEKTAEHTSLSPPPLSSIWRGRQWVTVSRPKTPRKTPNPISEKIVIVSQPEKKSKVQRLSAMISKLKLDFMEVQL